MTPRQLQLARHALGLDGRRTVSYRNYFVAGSGHNDYAEWMMMVGAGHAERGHFSSHANIAYVFRLTPAGARLALLPGETLEEENP
jgi:hypothetical protein